MKNHFVLFDLDGTITNSSLGIINSIQYALQKMGKKEEDQDRLKSYVGPSLKDTFKNNYFPEGEEYKKAISFYREYYADRGIFENELYDGIGKVLDEIHAQGGKIALATAKPTYFAKIILRHFDIMDKFDTVVGSHLGGTRSTKNEIIFEVLEANPDAVSQYKDGKVKIIGFIVGQVMQKTKGKANPALVQKLLKEKLDEK